MIIAKVHVLLKPGLLDPQGKTIKHALESLGFKGIHDVRVGKLITVALNHPNRQKAKRDVEQMCEKLLANPVVETYYVEFEKPR